ncbi:MAG: penicillin acylase family protein [Chloroflexi bacterium]|nr:penicillin acylase family protein [Chloroflexota bacterium]
MKLLKRVIKIVGAILIVLIIVGGIGGYWFVTKTHPQINGTLRVAGLKAQVEVLRDLNGIPHIYAANVDDLLFAQGYVHAQDRLWQMEQSRRTGAGRLSELSASNLNNDKFLRTIGLARAAKADWETANDDEKRALVAFSAGVNAFIDTHRDNLPVEYTLIGISPEPWTPVDSLGWAKVMAFNLGGSSQFDLQRAQFIANLGLSKWKEIAPDYPTTGPFIVDYSAADEYRAPTDALPMVSIGNPDFNAINARYDALQFFDRGAGSNNWVVDGTKTASGKPLLANDPHLGVQIPAIWYVVGLHCAPVSADCPYNVVGFALPATPGIVIGHNDRIAWGFTNVGPDVVDYFAEKLNPQNPNQYEFKGKFEDFQIVKETIKVKGGADVQLEVKISRHGPIMTPVFDGVKEPLALQWTALKERSHILGAVSKLDRARDFKEFREAMKLFDAPAQNTVYVDVDGNIGYQTPGNIPIRAKGDGSVPVDGASGDYEWLGYIPYDELPSAYNPAAHYIATANQQVAPYSYKYMISRDWAAPFRAQRINDLLRAKSKITVDDFKMIQGDSTSVFLLRLQKYVAGLASDKTQATRALELVKSWNGVLSTDSAATSILEATYARLVRNTFANKMSDDLFKLYQGYSDANRLAIYLLLEKTDAAGWDDPTTAQKESRDDILKKSFEQGVDDLAKLLGDSPSDWKWGKLHTATYAHPVGSVQPLNLLFNVGPIEVNGDGFTINSTKFSDTRGNYGMTNHPSMRFIADTSNWDRSQVILPVGQSGLPLNKHYSDMAQMWATIQYVPLYFSRGEVEKIREGLLVLTP